MATSFSTLFKNEAPWLTSTGEMADTCIVSFVRLVRNLPGHTFPGWSTSESRRAVVDTLLPLLLARPGFKTAFHADMTELGLEQRRILLERKLLTPCMAARQDGCHVIISRKQDASIMLNEEEHLVAHFYRQGMNLRDALADTQRFVTALEHDITFAHDPQHGYLTSLPAEIGEGLQLYVVLHLPALTMADMSESISRALEKLGANIAPFYNGMQEDTANTYILFSNAITPGAAEETLQQFEQTVNQLVVREVQMRTKLLTENPFDLTDRIGRAFGLLCHAVKLSYQEALDALSMLRLGHQCGMFCWKQHQTQYPPDLIRLATLLAPAHLAQQTDENIPSAMHPVLRAMQLKSIILDESPDISIPNTPLADKP